MNINEVNVELIKLISDLVVKAPATGVDAVALYETINEKLLMYLIKELPPVEAKIALNLVAFEKKVVGCLGK